MEHGRTEKGAQPLGSLPLSSLYHIQLNCMKKSILLLSFMFAVLQVADLNAQGCSDAGFCTLNNFKPNAIDTTTPANQVRIGASVGGADHSISVFGNYLEYDRRLGKRFGFDAKITSLAQSGNGFSTFGLSDVYANLHVKFREKFKLSVGAKIPLTDGNALKNGLPLPMDYQSSLGTYDLILGLAYGIKGLQLAAALQQPLTQNDNAFLDPAYPGDVRFAQFQSTNGFERKGDVLLRGAIPVSAGSQFKLTPSLLLIYHLGNDRFTNSLGKQQEIEGSQGLTINANAFVDYMLNQHNALQLSIGVPLLVREARPDGLTRSFVINLEYSLRF